ncbi:hypothetical protein JQ633_01025 [Bradyrhizobium tropiciagri]|uniref:hypothetical protein n=1 Tax=Bradyrhizobium tropiciagri TaxID=312253 RepID=UPI001BAD33FE|nr:hypothetical protein [Bradyrhizobium tropiciagri]MBR0868923.1 hypothetical protein [Bradyrhizobium tropiciagri]
MNDQELSETELFDQAVTEEGGEQADQQTEQQVDQQEQQADTQAASDQQQAEANDRQQVDDNAPHIPSWRLREVNEERRQLADRVKALEAERLEWQQRGQQQQRQPERQEQQQKDNRPDPLLDPEGYAKAVREEIKQDILNERREESMQAARDSNPQAFDEAFQASVQAMRNGDVSLRARMQASRDPGKTLLTWHKEQKDRAEVGNDLTAYKQRLREEALKDPEFRKLAMEAWREQGQQQSNNGRPKVELPPTLNGASRANSALRSDASEEKSDFELFNEIAG